MAIQKLQEKTFRLRNSGDFPLKGLNVLPWVQTFCHHGHCEIPLDKCKDAIWTTGKKSAF